MLQWKHENNGDTALLIEGARRVGKTTLVHEFARNEYAAHILIDFANVSHDVTNIFTEYRGDIDTVLRMLQLYFETKLPERKSVIVFDEVQRFPLAREMVKYLVADGRYDYIETGSLISIKKNVADIVIPSEEDRLTLNPLDFEEYLWAGGHTLLAAEIRAARKNLRALPEALHRKAIRLFDEYMLVGGMPQAVAAFVEDADFSRCDRIKRRILALYREDIEKFGDADSRRAYSIFAEIPGQLSAGSKRFKFSTLSLGARYRDFKSALRWLEDSHIVNICRLCTDPNIAYGLTASSDSLKCYLGDTGLLVSQAFPAGAEALGVYKAVQFGKVSINKGMIAENAVAQQLQAASEELYYFSWNDQRPREIDFLVTRGFSDAAGKPRICPIEVKSTKTYSTVSLDDFRRKYSSRLGAEIVLHPKQLHVAGNRQYLPLYMSFCL